LRSLFWLCLLLAGAATAVLGFVVIRDRPPENAPEPPVAAPPEPPPPPPAAEPPLRAYETVETLTEDLRDALAGPQEALDAEVRRVSERLLPKARSVLLGAAREEASPRVRALLVFAAGRHVPDEAILLAFLNDREPVVRQAAALAAAHAEGGRSLELMAGVTIPIGRDLPPASRRALEERLRREEDEGVRGTISAALGR
jgi:hypothetical protein